MGLGVVVYVDKMVVRITGLDIKGFKPYELEERLEEIVKSRVRIIGVTDDSIDMDIYNLEETDIYRNEDGIIEAISLTEGITALEVIEISKAEKIREIDYENLPKSQTNGCLKERWFKLDK